LENLQDLNDFEVDIPPANIDKILEDPEQYALDFIEISFMKILPKIQASFKSGQKFARANK
tara:strand:- start:876 stop:1058 length:183 start_codon:yes stop_codon:yes gene_type:complete